MVINGIQCASPNTLYFLLFGNKTLDDIYTYLNDQVDFFDSLRRCCGHAGDTMPLENYMTEFYLYLQVGILQGHVFYLVDHVDREMETRPLYAGHQVISFDSTRVLVRPNIAPRWEMTNHRFLLEELK